MVLSYQVRTETFTQSQYSRASEKRRCSTAPTLNALPPSSTSVSARSQPSESDSCNAIAIRASKSATARFQSHILVIVVSFFLLAMVLLYQVRGGTFTARG